MDPASFVQLSAPVTVLRTPTDWRLELLYLYLPLRNEG